MNVFWVMWINIFSGWNIPTYQRYGANVIPAMVNWTTAGSSRSPNNGASPRTEKKNIKIKVYKTSLIMELRLNFLTSLCRKIRKTVASRWKQSCLLFLLIGQAYLDSFSIVKATYNKEKKLTMLKLGRRIWFSQWL